MRTVKFLANLALIAFLVVTSLVLINSISYAGNLDLNGVVQPPSAYTSDGYGVVTPIPITQIDPNTFNTGIALPPPGPSVSSYPSYTINIGQTSPGTFQLQQYYAGATSDTAGGTHMEVLYNSAQNSAGAVIDPNTNMQWIQQITTTSVLPEGQSPEVDPNAKTAVHSGFPFYYPGVGASTVGAPTDYYKIGYTNSSYRFLDTPTRAATSPPQLDASTVPGLITWRGNVYLTQVNNNIITVQDGLQWGWDMKWATLLGNASGSFTNAT
ncbi:MAG: hypothetical protein ACXWMJ_11310, partial [Syntrophales bacterium]